MNYNLYAGAFLATVFVVMTVGIASDAIYHVEEPETQGYAIAVAEGGAAPAEEAVEEEAAPIGPQLASADVAAGANVFKKCASCHNAEAGGSNKTGPNLWNVVGAVPGVHEGFKYSSAMVAYGAEGKVWDFEALNRFLTKPRAYIDGTTMGFAGLNKEEERINLIAWLREQADNPVPLP